MEIDPLSVLILLLAILLLLKGFGVFKLLFNIDPDGFTLTINLGDILSSVAFIILWRKIEKNGDRINHIAERVAKLEGRLERWLTPHGHEHRA